MMVEKRAKKGGCAAKGCYQQDEMAEEFEDGDDSADNLREGQRFLVKYEGTKSGDGAGQDWCEHDVVVCLIENGKVTV
jgi:hypothetical protein